jgi:Flp pilus assembly protein TadG
MNFAQKKHSVASGLYRFRRNIRASAAMEFALIAPLFFGLLFAIIESALVFFAGQILETGTQDSARLFLTHQAQDSGMTQSAFKQDVCNRVAVLFSCNGIYVDVKTYSSFSNVTITSPIDANKNFVNNFTYQPSNPGDTVVVRVFYQWPLFVTGLGFNMSDINGNLKLLAATAAFRVEP